MVPPTFCVSLKSAKEKKEAISGDNSEFVIYFLLKMTSKVNLSQFQEAKKNLSVPSQSILLVTFHLFSKLFLSLFRLFNPAPGGAESNQSKAIREKRDNYEHH